MAMLSELNNVFPYFPSPNYPWLHMTSSVIHAMQRERDVYMEGITGVSEPEGDVEMLSGNEGVVDEENKVAEVSVAVPEPSVDVSAGTVLPLDKIGRAHV